MVQRDGRKKKSDGSPAPDRIEADDRDALIVKLKERIATLEGELLPAREDLQINQEELEVQAEELEAQNDDLRRNNEELGKLTRILQQREIELSRLAAIVTSSDDAIIGKTLGGFITSWNTGAERMYGYTADEALGHHINFIVPPELSGELQGILQKIGAGLRVDHHETQRVTKDGRRIDTSIAISPIVDPDGEVIGASTIARDITTAKRAEKALKKNQYILAKSQEMARVGNWAWNVQTGEMKGSDENYRLYGYQPHEVRATEEWFMSRVHTDDQDLLREFIRVVRLDGRRGSIDYRIVRQDGTTRYLMTIADKIIRDRAGQIKLIYGITQDITERKQMEEALKEREKQLASRLNAILSPGDVSEKTISEIVDIPSLQEMADALHAMTGVANAIIDLNGAVLVGSGWQDICTKFHRCHPETCKNCIESDLHLSSSVEAGKYAVYKCKNGMWDAVTPIAVNGKHIANLFTGQFFFEDEELDYDHFSRQAEMYGFNKDGYRAALEKVPRHSREKVRNVMDFYTRFSAMVSQLSYSNVQLAGSLIEQKESEQVLQEKMEEIEVQSEEIEVQNEELRANLDELAEKTRSLRESEERFSALADNIPNLAWMANADGGIFWYNRQWYDYTGTTLEEMQGWGWQKVHHPDYVRSVTEEWQARVQAGLPYDNVFPLRGKDGDYRWFLTRVTPIRDEEGKIQRWFGTNTDITVRKRIEEELKEAKAQAELYLDLMGHDISNMHQIALSQLELAQEIIEDDGMLPGENVEMIDTPIETLRRSARLIENVGKLQKLRAGEYRMEPVDLDRVLAEVVEENCVPGNDMAIRFAGSPGCRVKANPLIKEAFMNLVGNAIKHSQGPPRINIDVSRGAENGDSFYRIAIEDNGPGIPDEKKGEIFHRFKRGQTKAKGTGLGLYIVKTLVENFKGRVLVEDRVPGDYSKGSKFIVYLPVAEE
ncbi:MAG TPA: PAS domain S-box protein [Methanocella sp.]|jgi:PAS domain S-box-containing protein